MLDLLLVGVTVFLIFGLLFWVFTIKSRAKGEPPRIHTCQSCNCGKSHGHPHPVHDLETIIGKSTDKICNEPSRPDPRLKPL